MTAPLTPLHKTITVPWTPEAAFRRFTDQIAEWWPLESHSVGGKNAERVVFEGRIGGQIREVERGGKEHVWGTVLHWEPSTRVAFTWHPGQAPDTATQVELKFHPGESGTRVDLTHTGWERLGALARRARRGYPIGWAYVLRLYADQRSSPVVYAVDAVMWVVGTAKRLSGASAG